MSTAENNEQPRLPESRATFGRAGLIFGAAHIVGLGVALALVVAV